MSLFADLVSESSGSGAGIFDDILPPPADDGSFDRAEATRFASQSVAREDAAAARPAFRYAGSGRDVAPAQPARPAGAGVMWDGQTDDSRPAQRVKERGFRGASAERLQLERDVAAVRDRQPSGTISGTSGVDDLAGRVRRAANVAGMPGAADAAESITRGLADTGMATARALPQTAALLTDVGQLLTAGAVGGDASRVLRDIDRRMAADASYINRGMATRLAELVEAGDVDGAVGFLLANPKFALDTAIPAVGSMVPAVGGGALAARLATLPRAIRALPADELARIQAGAATAGANVANIVMNAGATYAQTGDYGAAGTAGVFSALGGRLTRGGAEGAVARGTGSGLLGTGLREGGQELIESMGQSIGEQTAENRFEPGKTLSQAAVEGTLGALAGAGAGFALPSARQRMDAAVAAEFVQRQADDQRLLSAESPQTVVAAAERALSRPNLAAQVIERAQQDIARAAQMDRSVELLGLPTRDEAGLRRQLERTNSEAVRIAISAELERRAALAQDRVLIPVTSDADLLARVPVEDPDQTASTVDDLDERSRPTADMPATSSFPVTRLADGSVVKANGRPWSDRGRALQAARALREDVDVVPYDQGDLRGYALRRREASDAGATAPRGTVGGAGQGSATVDDAAHEAAASPRNDLTLPTAAQALAGNYSKGHTRLGGLEVAIENPEGSVREDKKNTPPRWRVRMRAHYGYLKGTRDNTGEPVDTYIRPGTPTDYAGPVFVVDQIDERTGKFDEPKVLVGYTSQREAEAAYDAHHDDGNGPQRRGAVTPMSWQDFRGWVTSDGPQRPVAYREPSAQQAEVRAAARASEVSGTSQQAAPTPAAPPVSQGQPQRAESSDLILDQGDRPFASRARAQLAADRLGLGYRAVRVDAAEGRGWAVQPPPPREVRARRRVPGQSVKNPVLRAIAQAGGISTRYFREVTGEPYSPQTAMRLGLVEVFRRDGRGIDQITDEVLAGRFLTAAQLDDESDVGGVSAALDILADAIQRRADPTYRPPLPLGAEESEFERLRDRAYRDAGSGQSAPDAELEAERAAIMAEANALADQLTDDDVRAFMDPGARLSADTLLALGFTDAEAEALQADTDSDAASGSRTQAGSDAIGAAREGRGGTRAPQEAGPRVDRAEQPPDEYAPDDRAQRGGDRGRSARADRDLERRQEDGLPAAGRSDAADRAPGLLQRQRTFRPLEGDGRPRLVAKAIADEFEHAGVLALVGREASAPEDIAALAQVYRDPRYETLRVFYTRGNEIVHATALSSRLPNTSSAFPIGVSADDGIAAMRSLMDSVGADGYYLVHNHPSGDPTPSRGDLALTA
ncbi:MAG: JAB domain-containing protein [Betaproteobacteria bacterium]